MPNITIDEPASGGRADLVTRVVTKRKKDKVDLAAYRVTCRGYKQRINPLIGTGDYSAISNNIKFVHWPLMGGLFRYSEEGTGRGCSPHGPLFAVPKITAHPSTAIR